MKEKYSPEQVPSEDNVEAVEKMSPTPEVDTYLAQLRQRKEDALEKQHEKTVRRTEQKKLRVRENAVDKDLIAETKKSITDMLENDSAQLYDAKKASETKRPAVSVVVEKKEEHKHHLIPSFINAVFLKPSKKFAKETWGFIKRSKKLFGMTAILGLAHLGASGAPKTTGTPEDTLKKDIVKTVVYEKPLTTKVMQEWNDFIKWVKTETKYKDTVEQKKLNKDRSIGQKLMEQFIAEHPGTDLEYNMVPQIQREILKVRDAAQDFEKRHGKDGSILLKNASDEDSWIGTKTLTYGFFPMKVVNSAGYEVKNLGLVDGTLNSAQLRDMKRKIEAQLGVEVKIEKLADGYFYEDPNAPGDMIKVWPK